MNVLFVGGANTGRSPLAEALLRERLRRDDRMDIEVSSAGLTVIPGTAVSAVACVRALADGVDLSGHRSRALDASLLSWADLVLVFEEGHLLQVAQRPGAQAPACGLLGDDATSRAGGEASRDFQPLDPLDEAAWGRGVSRLRAAVEALYRTLSPAGHDIYAQTVERLFRERTGGTVLPAPADWEQIDRWWSAGVPLWIVLEALRDTMQRTGRRGDARRMRRLRYCAPAVEERFSTWVRSRIGEGSEPAAVPDHRGDAEGAHHGDAPAAGEAARWHAASRLKEAAERAAARGLRQVCSLLEEALGEVQSAPRAEDPAVERLRLHEIDERIAARLHEAAGQEVVAAERAEAQTQLAPHQGRMTADAFERTVERLVQRRLRERLGVPDLPS